MRKVYCCYFCSSLKKNACSEKSQKELQKLKEQAKKQMIVGQNLPENALIIGAASGDKSLSWLGEILRTISSMEKPRALFTYLCCSG